jgi:uncharacterized NAD(P)/FAD-binding protein YdhS
MRERHVVIVGGGFCGALVAIHLLYSRGFPPLRITIIDPTGRIGAGEAYGTRDPAHILNVPAGRMSAFVDDAEHFLRFAVRRDPSVTPATFARRSLYGEYLADCLESAEEASAHCFVRVTGEVADVSPSAHGQHVTLTSGGSFVADAVVLAIGAPRAPPAWGGTDPGFVRSPADRGALDSVPRGANIVVVGTGLTMVDVTLSVTRDPSVNVRAVSRHGLLPQTHARGAIRAAESIAPDIADATTTRALLRAVRAAIAAEEKAGGDWRSVIDALRAATPDLWRALSASEQRRFLRHVRPFWQSHRHRVPRPSWETIASLIEAGRLVVDAGRIHQVSRRSDGAFDVAIEFSRRPDRIDVCADVVFDCTGPAPSVERSASRVIRGLLESGLAIPDASGLGLRAEPTGEIIGADGGRSALFAVGPLVRGLTYEGTAVRELRVQAKRTAAAIANRFAAHSRPPRARLEVPVES